MTTITLKIQNLAEIKRVFEKAPAKMAIEINGAIKRILTKLESTTKKEAPVNKRSGGGNLRQSITTKMTGLASGVLQVKANYAAAVHEGTRPHIIRIREKRVLADKRAGQIFGTVVQHPGTRANPFIQRAIDQEQSFINSEFLKAVENALK